MRKSASLRQVTTGAVTVEFLIVFSPMMTLVLCIAQLGLIYGADLAVNHAASRAARAAMVILPDDSEGFEDRYAEVAPFQIGDGRNGLEAYKDAPKGGRLDQIRQAAELILVPFSPFPGSPGKSFTEERGNYLEDRSSVAVTFPDGNGGYRTVFRGTDKITVRATYLYLCRIPLANRILCHDVLPADPEISLVDSRRTGERTDWWSLALRAERRVPLQGKYK